MEPIKGFISSNKAKMLAVIAFVLYVTSASSLAPIANFNLYYCNNLSLKIAAGNTLNHEWILDKTVANVEFYHAITVCNGKKVVFLKFNNKNKYRVKVSWMEVFKIPSGERKDGYNGKKELVLSPGITAPADCTDAANKKSIILPSEIDPMTVTEIVDFNYNEITVSTI